MKNFRFLVLSLFVLGQTIFSNSEEWILTAAAKNMLALEVQVVAFPLVTIPVPSSWQPYQAKLNNKVRNFVDVEIPKMNLHDYISDATRIRDYSYDTAKKKEEACKVADVVGKSFEAFIISSIALRVCLSAVNSLLYKSNSSQKTSDIVCGSLYSAFIIAAMNDASKASKK